MPNATNRYGYYVGLMVPPVLVVTVRILPDRVRMILNLKSNVIGVNSASVVSMT